VRKTLCVLIGIMLLVISISACTPAEEAMKITYGTFTMASTDSQIVLREDNTLTIVNYDMSELEKISYEDFMIAQQNAKREEGNRLSADEEQKIREGIDLNGQFLDQVNSFEAVDEDGWIGIYVPVEGCEYFLYMQFYPSDNSIVFDEKIFSLEKG